MTTRKSKRATPVLADATAATNNSGKETKDEDNNNGKESLSENVNPSKDKDNDNKKVLPSVNKDTDSPIRPTDNNGSYSQHFNPVPVENQESEKNTTIKPSSVGDLSK